MVLCLLLGFAEGLNSAQEVLGQLDLDPSDDLASVETAAVAAEPSSSSRREDPCLAQMTPSPLLSSSSSSPNDPSPFDLGVATSSVMDEGVFLDLPVISSTSILSGSEEGLLGDCDSLFRVLDPDDFEIVTKEELEGEGASGSGDASTAQGSQSQDEGSSGSKAKARTRSKRRPASCSTRGRGGGRKPAAPPPSGRPPAPRPQVGTRLIAPCLDERLCQVCRAKSAGRHLYYGAKACQGCRAFFRRAVADNRHRDFYCREEQDCQVGYAYVVQA